MNKYLIGTGNWSSDLIWSTTNGGSNDTTHPVAGDNVFCNASSGAVTLTVDVSSACDDLLFTGGGSGDFTGTFAGSAALNIAGSLTIVSGMVYGYTGVITFSATSGTKTITTGGKVLRILNFTGNGGTWELQDNLDTTKYVTHTAGTIDLNDCTMSGDDTNGFTTSGTTARGLIFGSGTLSFLNFTYSGSGLTLSEDTGTIEVTRANGTFAGNGETYYNVVLTDVSGDASISGANTFNNLSILGGAEVDGYVDLSADQVVSGVFKPLGNSVTNRLWVKSNTIGTQRTITAASIDAASNYFDLTDIKLAGACSKDLSSLSVGDGGGNDAGITFPTPKDRYWMDTNGGSWSSTGSWSETSNGATGASVPLCHDTAYFDDHSITSGSRTIIVDMPRICAMDFTDIANTPTLAFSQTTYLFGAVNWEGITHGGTARSLYFYQRSNFNFDSSGISIPHTMYFYNLWCTATLMSDLLTTVVLYIVAGTFDANDFNVTALRADSGTTTTYSRTIKTGTGTWTLTGSGVTTSSVWYMVATNLTITSEGETILFNSTAATNKGFTGAEKTYNKLKFSGSGNPMLIVDSNTFDNIEVDSSGGANTLSLTAGTTQTLTGADPLKAIGTSGKAITIQSSSYATWPFSIATLNCTASGGVSLCDYLNLKSVKKTGDAKIYPGKNSGLETSFGFEVNNLLPLMTANDAPSPFIVSASSYYAYEYNKPYNSSDKDSHRGWRSTTNDNDKWVKWDLGKNCWISAVRISSQHAITDNEHPKDFILSTSTNDSDYSIASTQAGIVWSQPDTKIYAFASPIYCRYVKINISATQGGGVQCGFGEFEIIKSLENEYYMKDTASTENAYCPANLTGNIYNDVMIFDGSGTPSIKAYHDNVEKNLAVNGTITGAAGVTTASRIGQKEAGKNLDGRYNFIGVISKALSTEERDNFQTYLATAKSDAGYVPTP